MLLVGLWHWGLSDQAVEDMANVNLHVLCFLGLLLEDDVPNHLVLSRFRTKLAKAQAWDALLSEINRQIEKHSLMVKSVFGYKQHTVVDGNGLQVVILLI
jgi:transposase, IS5 family